MFLNHATVKSVNIKANISADIFILPECVQLAFAEFVRTSNQMYDQMYFITFKSMNSAKVKCQKPSVNAKNGNMRRAATNTTYLHWPQFYMEHKS